MERVLSYSIDDRDHGANHSLKASDVRLSSWRIASKATAARHTTTAERAAALGRRRTGSTCVYILHLSLSVVFQAAGQRRGASDYLRKSVLVAGGAVGNLELGDAVEVREHAYKHLDLVVVLGGDLQRLASDSGLIKGRTCLGARRVQADASCAVLATTSITFID